MFLSVANFRNLFIQSTILAVLALGQTFVIMTRGIDLSIGGTWRCPRRSASGWRVMRRLPGPLAILVGLAVGGLVGLVNGFAVTVLGITPLITTLATLSVTRGATFAYTNGSNITPVPTPSRFRPRASLRPALLRDPPVVLASRSTSFSSRTVFGRSVYATGGNEVASRLAGIPTSRVIMITYVICGSPRRSPG